MPCITSNHHPTIGTKIILQMDLSTHINECNKDKSKWSRTMIFNSVLNKMKFEGRPAVIKIKFLWTLCSVTEQSNHDVLFFNLKSENEI